MSLSAKEAAEQVGMTRQGIMKAIRQGKISAQKDLNGQWQIEPVELFRVYAPVSCTQPEATSFHEVTPQVAPVADATPALQREVEHLKLLLLAKDEVIQAKEDALEDLRRAMLLLTTTQQTQQRSWWARLFGGE